LKPVDAGYSGAANVSGLVRYMKVLRLFDEARSEWTVQGISEVLDVPASTIYRTVRELIAERLLDHANEGYYRLGSAFVEFDRMVRLTDPLFRDGTAFLREVSLQARVPCIAVLARLYGDTVMCVADAASPDSNVHTSYERGLPRPLMSGATSKVILAQLPTRRLNRLLEKLDYGDRHPFALSQSEFRDELSAIRRRGFCVTRGEVDKGMVGIAAPISVPEMALTASVSLVVPSAAMDDAIERRLVLLLVSSASLLAEQIKQRSTITPTLATQKKAK
jgi:DNA-binding IclR family transcriptional regulator